MRSFVRFFIHPSTTHVLSCGLTFLHPSTLLLSYSYIPLVLCSSTPLLFYSSTLLLFHTSTHLLFYSSTYLRIDEAWSQIWPSCCWAIAERQSSKFIRLPSPRARAVSLFFYWYTRLDEASHNFDHHLRTCCQFSWPKMDVAGCAHFSKNYLLKCTAAICGNCHAARRVLRNVQFRNRAPLLVDPSCFVFLSVV